MAMNHLKTVATFIAGAMIAALIGVAAAPVGADGDGYTEWGHRLWWNSNNQATQTSGCQSFGSGTRIFDVTYITGTAVKGVQLNVVVVNPSSTGYAVFWDGGVRPDDSHLSWSANEGRQVNAFHVKVNSADQFYMYTSTNVTLCVGMPTFQT